MLTDTIYHVWPSPGGNLYPEDNEIHKFSRRLPVLHHHAFSLSYIRVISQKKIFFKKRSILTLFAPLQRPQGGRKPEIHNHTKFEKNWSSGYQEK
jgi:hypothetical protein